MKSCDIKFKINEEGYLLVSCDKGCTWENIGMVKGDASTVQGPQGEQGPQGPSGADGANGADGNTPYINELTGTWWIGTTDTGVVAEGANGEVDIEGSSDIAVVGTPSVTKRVVGNKVILKFHELKGEPGIAPEITAERNDSTNSVTFSVDGVPVATIYDGIHYTAGSHIVITPTDTNHSVIACDLVAGNGININNNNEIELILTVPTERNELIYSDDGSTLTTHPLMFTGGLVVDTPEDLALCEASADVTMSAVYSSWNPYGSSSDDKGKWGYCDSEGSGTTKNVVLVDGSTQAVPLYTFNGNPQGYIFNIKNTDRITGYYSDTLYSSYDSIVAAGIIPSLKNPGATDYMAIIPALYGDNEVFCGLSVSANNTINTSSDGRESVGSEGHTISVIAWTQSSPDAAVSSPTGAIQLLKNSEGLLISEYNSSLCNGTSSGTASTIQVRTQRRGNIITIWASDPYPTTDDDFTHRNDIHSDCPIVINLEEYTLSYTYKNSSDILTTVTKDFSDSANPPSGYTAANVTSIKAIFDKLKTSAKRGYEVCSNPGSIFRNVSSDELILDVTPGENKVYGFNGSTWVVLNTTPLAMFLNGSRIAWNRITDKLFYNDGSAIYRISAVPDIPQSITYTAGDNISIDSNHKISAVLPKEQHKLTYYDPSLIGNPYKGLVNEQLMYEDGIVVDNPTDLASCKSDNDFTIQEIGTSWPTELISNNKYLEWTSGSGYSSEIDANALLPGGITSTNNGFWYYNQTDYTVDAKFNDDYFSRRACLYNPSTPTNVFHDALYGFFESSGANDAVGCGFIGFGTIQTTDSDGTWCPTVMLTVSADPEYKDGSFRAFNIGLGIAKRKADTSADNREKYYPADTSNPRNGVAGVAGFGIVGSSGSTVVSGSTVESGKCVVRNTSLITNPWSEAYYGPSYIRVRTEKVGNVITWRFSQILIGSITDLANQIPDFVDGAKVQIDLGSYKVRYITQGMSAWAEFDCSSFSTYLDVLKNDAHFMLHQSSTPKGRIYNVSSLRHRMILDINTDLVWQRSGDTWSIVSNTTPLDLFTGSHLNFNEVTKKLWYSNGSRIYQIGGSFS